MELFIFWGVWWRNLDFLVISVCTTGDTRALLFYLIPLDFFEWAQMIYPSVLLRIISKIKHTIKCKTKNVFRDYRYCTDPYPLLHEVSCHRGNVPDFELLGLVQNISPSSNNQRTSFTPDRLWSWLVFMSWIWSPACSYWACCANLTQRHKTLGSSACAAGNLIIGPLNHIFPFLCECWSPVASATCVIYSL